MRRAGAYAFAKTNSPATDAEIDSHQSDSDTNVNNKMNVNTINNDDINVLSCPRYRRAAATLTHRFCPSHNHGSGGIDAALLLIGVFTAVIVAVLYGFMDRVHRKAQVLQAVFHGWEDRRDVRGRICMEENLGRKKPVYSEITLLYLEEMKRRILWEKREEELANKLPEALDDDMFG